MTNPQDKEISPNIENILPISTGSGIKQTKNPRGISAYVPIARCLSSTNRISVLN
jgi:hypothetical protein